MLHSRILSTPVDFLRYETLYLQRAGVAVDPEYLRDSHVRVFFQPGETAPDGAERWLGGYIQHRNGRLRYLAGFDESQRRALLDAHHLSPQDWVEISGLFIETRTTGYLGRLQVYLTMLLEAFRTGKPIFLGGAVLSGLQGYQRQVFPHLLFNGPALLGGKVRRLQVYYVRRYEVPFTLAWALLKDVVRHLFHARPRRKTIPV